MLILFHLIFKMRIVHFEFPRSTSKWISFLNPTSNSLSVMRPSCLFISCQYIYLYMYTFYQLNKHGFCPLTFSVERKLLNNLSFSLNQGRLKAAEAKLKKPRFVHLSFQYTCTFSVNCQSVCNPRHLTSFGDNRPLSTFENLTV